MFVSTMWLPSTTRDRWCGRHPMVGCVACSGCVPCGCFGGYSVRETPGPIPNPVVKPYHADGTARGIWWESRTLPDFIYCLWFSACMAENHKRISGCFWTNGSVGILTATGTVMCTLWRDRGLPPVFWGHQSWVILGSGSVDPSCIAR